MPVQLALAGIAAPSAAPERLLRDTHLALIAATAVGVALCAFALLFAAYWMWRRQVFSASRAHRNLGIALSVAPALYLLWLLGAGAAGLVDMGAIPHFAILGVLGALSAFWCLEARRSGQVLDRSWIVLNGAFLIGTSALLLLGILLKSAAQ